MRIVVRDMPYEYAAGLGSVVAGVYSCSVAAQIGRGPVCLLLYLVAFGLIGFGWRLLFNCLQSSAPAPKPHPVHQSIKIRPGEPTRTPVPRRPEVGALKTHDTVA